jgi:ABC-2 type transport system permease protein
VALLGALLAVSLVLSVVESMLGALIPLPFFPDTMRRVMELFPFASMENTPYMIYCGVLYGPDAVRALVIQLVWLVIIIGGGKLYMDRSIRRIVIQGG